MHYWGKIAVLSSTQNTVLPTLCGQNVELLNVKPVKFSLNGEAA